MPETAQGPESPSIPMPAPDYSKWSLGCLVRELGKNLPAPLRAPCSFYAYTSLAADITDVVKVPNGTLYRAQWLLMHFLRQMRENSPVGVKSPMYDELKLRLDRDQRERGCFETAT